MKTYCFDLDETLCNTFNKDYKNSTPITEMIDRVNYLYEQGNILKMLISLLILIKSKMLIMN